MQSDTEQPRSPPPKRRPRLTLLDAALAALGIAAVGYFAWRTHSVLDYRWNWSTIWPFVIKTDPATGHWVPNLIVEGLLTTIRLAFWGIVCAGVIILRYRRKDLARPFRVPFFPVLPGLGIVLCFYLMVSLPGSAWLRFAVWLAAGLVLYGLYGYHRSALNRASEERGAEA